ncbi:MAG: RIP metalloprotease RseP, partial [Deltaproteobacteria bacterium]
MIYVVSFIVVLGILIFVHEFGHFLVARLLGIEVQKFSLGFGPKLAGFERGGTEYLVSAIPFGGYVKLLGESPEEEVDPGKESRSFSHRPPLHKLLVVLAGPGFNIVFAAFVFWFLFMAGMPVLKPVVGEVLKGTPAERAGI